MNIYSHLELQKAKGKNVDQKDATLWLDLQNSRNQVHKQFPECNASKVYTKITRNVNFFWLNEKSNTIEQPSNKIARVKEIET